MHRSTRLALIPSRARLGCCTIIPILRTDSRRGRCWDVGLAWYRWWGVNWEIWCRKMLAHASHQSSNPRCSSPLPGPEFRLTARGRWVFIRGYGASHEVINDAQSPFWSSKVAETEIATPKSYMRGIKRIPNRVGPKRVCGCLVGDWFPLRGGSRNGVDDAKRASKWAGRIEQDNQQRLSELKYQAPTSPGALEG